MNDNANPQRTALSISNAIVDEDFRLIPSVREMLDANWDRADLVSVFNTARQEMYDMTRDSPEKFPKSQQMKLLWCDNNHGDIHNLNFDAGSTFVIRILLWSLWKDLMPLKHDAGDWAVGLTVQTDTQRLEAFEAGQAAEAARNDGGAVAGAVGGDGAVQAPSAGAEDRDESVEPGMQDAMPQQRNDNSHMGNGGFLGH